MYYKINHLADMSVNWASTWVTIFGQLASQELVKLGFEHAVSDEIKVEKRNRLNQEGTDKSFPNEFKDSVTELFISWFGW